MAGCDLAIATPPVPLPNVVNNVVGSLLAMPKLPEESSTALRAPAVKNSNLSTSCAYLNTPL